MHFTTWGYQTCATGCLSWAHSMQLLYCLNNSTLTLPSGRRTMWALEVAIILHKTKISQREYWTCVSMSPMNHSSVLCSYRSNLPLHQRKCQLMMLVQILLQVRWPPFLCTQIQDENMLAGIHTCRLSSYMLLLSYFINSYFIIFLLPYQHILSWLHHFLHHYLYQVKVLVL